MNFRTAIGPTRVDIGTNGIDYRETREVIRIIQGIHNVMAVRTSIVNIDIEEIHEVLIVSKEII